MYIAIAGNIGSGKTTLTEMLSQLIGWKPFYEDLENNDYLSDFYDDMGKWSFQLQITFLVNRFYQYKKMRESEGKNILDRSIYEDAYIFAKNLKEMNFMSERNYHLYLSIFKIIESQVSPPDMLIYLKGNVSTLLTHIKRRGRDFESNIEKSYLEKLNEKYDMWYKNYPYPKTFINIDEIKFSEESHFFQEVIANLKNLKIL